METRIQTWHDTNCPALDVREGDSRGNDTKGIQCHAIIFWRYRCSRNEMGINQTDCTVLSSSLVTATTHALASP